MTLYDLHIFVDIFAFSFDHKRHSKSSYCNIIQIIIYAEIQQCSRFAITTNTIIYIIIAVLTFINFWNLFQIVNKRLGFYGSKIYIYINNMVFMTKYMQKWYGFKTPKNLNIFIQLHSLTQLRSFLTSLRFVLNNILQSPDTDLNANFYPHGIIINEYKKNEEENALL
ncbi:hypothetical protein U3516DRAFT_761378 [Neocallimastix sp. 'constans']